MPRQSKTAKLEKKLTEAEERIKALTQLHCDVVKAADSLRIIKRREQQIQQQQTEIDRLQTLVDAETFARTKEETEKQAWVDAHKQLAEVLAN